jgi:hypothetical protein
LGEGEEGGRYEDVDAEEVEARVVEEEGVLEGEEPVFVRVKGAGVFDDVDIFGWPAGGYVGEDDLLEEGPLGEGWLALLSMAR